MMALHFSASFIFLVVSSRCGQAIASRWDYHYADSPRCDGLPTSRRDPKKQKRYHILDIRTWICSCGNSLNSRVNNLLSDNVLCEGYKALTGPERKDFYKDAGMTVSSL